MDAEAVDAQALIAAVAARAQTDDPLELLEAAVTFAGLVGQAADAMVDHYVAGARAAGLSWTVIGDRLGISKQAARQRFSPRLDVSGGLATEPAPPAPRLVSCLEVAQAAADAEDSVPGTQHLLLGLLQVGVAANVLDRLGVTRERVREVSARLLEPTGGDSGRRMIGDGEAEQAVSSARRFAASRGQNLARTEHLLFVLALDPGSSARRVLDHLGVDPARVKKELNDQIPPPAKAPRRARRAGKPVRHARACSFCGCDPHRPIVHGPGVRICRDCIVLATDILGAADEQASRAGTPAGRLLP
jgi:Clp amino terminal domain, pathogenicity island component/ClpX C4-type zinc finger